MTRKDPTTHKYDTDEYTVIDTGIKRCAECGRLKRTGNKDALQALDCIQDLYKGCPDEFEAIRAALSPVDVERLAGIKAAACEYALEKCCIRGKIVTKESEALVRHAINHLVERGLICPKGYVCVPEEEQK